MIKDQSILTRVIILIILIIFSVDYVTDIVKRKLMLITLGTAQEDQHFSIVDPPFAVFYSITKLLLRQTVRASPDGGCLREG